MNSHCITSGATSSLTTNYISPALGTTTNTCVANMAEHEDIQSLQLKPERSGSPPCEHNYPETKYCIIDTLHATNTPTAHTNNCAIDIFHTRRTPPLATICL